MLQNLEITRNNRYFVFSMTLILLLLLTSASEWVERLNNRLSDQFIRHQAAELTTDPSIHILNIDDYSASRLNPLLGKFPWPRAVYAELLESLGETKLDAIVFDIIFSEPDVRMKMSDAAFNEAIAENGKVFLAAVETNPLKGNSKLRQIPLTAGITASKSADLGATAGLILPWAIEAKNWQIGAINFYPDSDGVGRRYQLYRNLSGWHFPTLPGKIAQSLGFQIPSTNEFIMQWKGGSEKPFSECNFYDLYTALIEGKKVPDAPDHCKDEASVLNWLETGILIIGNTSTGMDDFRKTPIEDFYPGVYILATAIDNLKNNHSITVAGPTVQLVFLVVPIIFLGMLFFHPQGSFKTQVIYGVSFIAAIVLLYSVTSYLLLEKGYLLPIAYTLGSSVVALVSLVMARGIEEHLNRRKTVQIFNRFMDPEVVAELLEKGELKSTLENKTIEITVLFSDIRGFTSLSEKHDAETIVRLLNLYFSRQVKAIFLYGGTLDKFIGDAVMAFWGAPLDCPNQAEKAVSAALEMERELELFKQEIGELGEGFDIGIGIHTGMAVVGMIGSEQRYDYTCIGDSVNLASRIEGVTKGVSRILVSEATKNQCGVGFDFEEKGSYSVKGREQEVRLYAPIRKGNKRLV